MADYLYLFRGAPPANRSPEETQKHMAKWGAWIGRLREEGKFKAGDPLESSGTVVAGSSKSVSDGPFAETKDVVGGYLIVTASDLMFATEMAKGCPIFENDGSVEVRAITSM